MSEFVIVLHLIWTHKHTHTIVLSILLVKHDVVGECYKKPPSDPHPGGGDGQ